MNPNNPQHCTAKAYMILHIANTNFDKFHKTKELQYRERYKKQIKRAKKLLDMANKLVKVSNPVTWEVKKLYYKL